MIKLQSIAKRICEGCAGNTQGFPLGTQKHTFTACSLGQYDRILNFGSNHLIGVLRGLRDAAKGVTVQDVAAHWGFWHLGQFAQDYKRLFGELPSTTLRHP
jgi:AraC-like DNA-binding protein